MLGTNQLPSPRSLCNPRIDRFDTARNFSLFPLLPGGDDSSWHLEHLCARSSLAPPPPPSVRLPAFTHPPNRLVSRRPVRHVASRSRCSRSSLGIANHLTYEGGSEPRPANMSVELAKRLHVHSDTWRLMTLLHLRSRCVAYLPNPRRGRHPCVSLPMPTRMGTVTDVIAWLLPCAPSCSSSRSNLLSSGTTRDPSLQPGCRQHCKRAPLKPSGHASDSWERAKRYPPGRRPKAKPMTTTRERPTLSPILHSRDPTISLPSASLTLPRLPIDFENRTHDPDWKLTPRIQISCTSCSFCPGPRFPWFGFAILGDFDRLVHRCCLLGTPRHRFRDAPCIQIGSVDGLETRPPFQGPNMARKTGEKRGHPLWVPTLFVKNRVRFLAPLSGTGNWAPFRTTFRREWRPSRS